MSILSKTLTTLEHYKKIQNHSKDIFGKKLSYIVESILHQDYDKTEELTNIDNVNKFEFEGYDSSFFEYLVKDYKYILAYNDSFLHIIKVDIENVFTEDMAMFISDPSYMYDNHNIERVYFYEIKNDCDYFLTSFNEENCIVQVDINEASTTFRYWFSKNNSSYHFFIITKSYQDLLDIKNTNDIKENFISMKKEIDNKGILVQKYLHEAKIIYKGYPLYYPEMISINNKDITFTHPDHIEEYLNHLGIDNAVKFFNNPKNTKQKEMFELNFLEDI